jgi:hypothetical protein
MDSWQRWAAWTAQITPYRWNIQLGVDDIQFVVHDGQIIMENSLNGLDTWFDKFLQFL